MTKISQFRTDYGHKGFGCMIDGMLHKAESGTVTGEDYEKLYAVMNELSAALKEVPVITDDSEAS